MKLLLSVGIICLILTGCTKKPQEALLTEVGIGIANNDAFIQALQQGNLEKVQELLTAGQEANAILDDDGHTPLHYAIGNKHVAIIKTLLDHGAKTDCQDAQHHTPLDYAVGKGDLAVVKYLINTNNANVTTNQEGYTLLHLAVIYGHLEVIKYLVEGCKADINCTTTQEGNTPMHLAAANGHLAVVKCFVKKNRKLLSRQTRQGTDLYIWQ